MNNDQSGIRALADVQAEGLRAAGLLLERMLAAEKPAPGPRSPRLTIRRYSKRGLTWHGARRPDCSHPDILGP